ncbi:MAG: nitroreductase family protein [Chloroflexi bacterium]|nr:nitroreductase family protein [Chloroflexota bacterium]
MPNPPSAWRIDESKYPKNGSPADRLRFLLRYAVLAPSGHNSQPWMFRLSGDAVELHADTRRELPIVDPDNRELVISCGAALSFLRIAMRRFGHEPVTELLPDSNNANFLARIRLGEEAVVPEEDTALFQAITKRRTNRQSYDVRPIPFDLYAALQEAAQTENAWLHFVPSGREREQVGEMTEQGGIALASNPKFRRELASWIRTNWSRAKDGMPGFTFGWSGSESLLMPLAMRVVEWGRAQGRAARDLVNDAPAHCVLGVSGDEPIDWLRTGQALGRVLLYARSQDVWAHFLNQPVQVPELRRRLAELLGKDGPPQLAFRMGYALDVRPSPRRPVKDVLT